VIPIPLLKFSVFTLSSRNNRLDTGIKKKNYGRMFWEIMEGIIGKILSITGSSLLTGEHVDTHIPCTHYACKTFIWTVGISFPLQVCMLTHKCMRTQYIAYICKTTCINDHNLCYLNGFDGKKDLHSKNHILMHTWVIAKSYKHAWKFRFHVLTMLVPALYYCIYKEVKSLYLSLDQKYICTEVNQVMD